LNSNDNSTNTNSANHSNSSKNDNNINNINNTNNVKSPEKRNFRTNPKININYTQTQFIHNIHNIDCYNWIELDSYKVRKKKNHDLAVIRIRNTK